MGVWDLVSGILSSGILSSGLVGVSGVAGFGAPFVCQVTFPATRLITFLIGSMVEFSLCLSSHRDTFLAHTILAVVGIASASADEFVEITVPLRDGSYYSPREFCEQCNQRLGMRFPLGLITDQERKLTDGERKALIIASAVGFLPSTIDDHRLVIKLPNPQDDATRRKNRELIEKYLGLSMDWPKDKGLHLPDDFRPDARTILLVHGLESRSDELRRFQQACRIWGVQTLVFDYPNDGPIAWSGDRLSEDLKAIAEKNPATARDNRGARSWAGW